MMPDDARSSSAAHIESLARDGGRRSGYAGVLSGGLDGTVPREARDSPQCFHDLRLDMIIGDIVAPFADYDLAPLFHVPLDDLHVIAWRHEVFRDLEKEATMGAMRAFSHAMRDVRACLELAEKRYFDRERQIWFLRGSIKYGRALRDLGGSLGSNGVASRGLRQLLAYVEDYTASAAFATLTSEAAQIDDALAAIRYAILIKDSSITIQRYNGEPDYSSDVEATFAKFRQGDSAVRGIEVPKPSGMNHIEAQMLDRVALLNTDTFAALATFCASHAGFVDAAIVRFDREVQFYVAYLGYIGPFRKAGLSFCYPQVSATSKEIDSTASFDLALAKRLLAERIEVVRNDFRLRGAERIFVVSGPNNGGKTTFARTFGQLHYLASIGCPVPGSEAHLFLVDRLFTHFEREEDVATLRGKLEDELFRIHEILEAATSVSIVVMNEIFASTTLCDAIWLGKQVISRMSDLDLLGVCVTFLDELAALNQKTVSMVSTVDPADPAVRTHKLERRPADGLAFAMAIADKHGVTHERLLERIVP